MKSIIDVYRIIDVGQAQEERTLEKHNE